MCHLAGFLGIELPVSEAGGSGVMTGRLNSLCSILTYNQFFFFGTGTQSEFKSRPAGAEIRTALFPSSDQGDFSYIQVRFEIAAITFII